MTDYDQESQYSNMKIYNKQNHFHDRCSPNYALEANETSKPTITHDL